MACYERTEMIFDGQGRPMVPVHTCWSDTEASVVISFLESHGISAQANSEVPHSILPVTVGGLGRVRVLVTEDDAAMAEFVLAQVRADAAEPSAGEPSEP